MCRVGARTHHPSSRLQIGSASKRTVSAGMLTPRLSITARRSATTTASLRSVRASNSGLATAPAAQRAARRPARAETLKNSQRSGKPESSPFPAGFQPKKATAFQSSNPHSTVRAVFAPFRPATASQDAGRDGRRARSFTTSRILGARHLGKIPPRPGASEPDLVTGTLTVRH